MEQVQRSDLRAVGQVGDLADGRVAPAGPALVLRIGVGRIRDQGVGSPDELDQLLAPRGVVPL